MHICAILGIFLSFSDKSICCIILILQAAKEFETEIKKEPDSIEGDPAEKPTAISEQEKQDVNVPSSKESIWSL